MKIDPWPGAVCIDNDGTRLRVVDAPPHDSRMWVARTAGGWVNAGPFDDDNDGPLLLELTDPDTFRGTVARLALRLGHPPELVAEGVWFGCRNGVWAIVSGQNVRGEGPAASGVSSTMTTFGRECAGVEDRVEALRRAMERA